MPATPVSFPLGGPTVSGTTITVDQALNQPTRITRDVAQLAEQNFFAGRVFSNAGGVSGGSILFELPNPIATDLWPERGFQEVAPMSEAPILTFLRGVPVVSKPRKFMGKFPVSKEARKRNDQRYFTNAVRQTANGLALTLDSMALAVLDAAITANSRTLAGQSWATAAALTMTTRAGTNVATSDLLAAAKVIQLEERGIALDSIIYHPNQFLSLSQAAAAQGLTVEALLAAGGIRNSFVSQRNTAGTALLYASGQVGGWANEFPLGQTVWVEEETDNTTWYQWSVSPAVFVDNPYALLRLTGIA